MSEILDWFLYNPARVMVAASILFTISIGRAEMGGRRSGGSGWLTLFRLGTGAAFTVLTAIVAGLFGGIGFFGYFFIQVVVAVIIPIVWMEKM